MINSQLIAGKIKKICEKKSISVNKALSESGAGERLYHNMLSGSYPSIDKIIKLADYLDSSIDDLIGRTNNQRISTGNITNSNIISGNNNTFKGKEELSVQEQDLLNTYRSSDGKTQMKIMQFIYNIEEEQMREK